MGETEQKEANLVRAPAVAGSFYPAQAKDLQSEVKQLLLQEIAPRTGIRGAVVPHAGYMFSGAIAGTCYAAMRDMRPEYVVLIGPSHREYFPGVCVFDGAAFQTPLGLQPIATDVRDAVAVQHERIFLGQHGHRGSAEGEHALEVQIPFIRMLWGEVGIVPIAMGEQSWENCEALGNALAQTLTNRNAIVIASSDLSHYHSYEDARELDAEFIAALERADARLLYDGLKDGRFEACGGGPVVSAMIACRKLGAGVVETLAYANSGDVWHDRSRVVGYLAALFRQQPA